MLDRDLGSVPSPERIRREEEFPADSEKRFEAVFAAIGNSEAKCVALLCLSESPLSVGDFHKEFLKLSDSAWKTERKLQAAWAEYSLVPIGMVAAVDTMSHGSDDYVLGFRLTESGKKYGKPIAAHLLSESRQQSHSLLTIFGSTHTPGKNRAVVNRAQVLEYLASRETAVSNQDIIKELGLGKSLVGQMLLHFENLGMVDYEFFDVEQRGKFKYSINKDYEKLPPHFPWRPSLSNYIYEIISDFKGDEISTDDVYEALATVYEDEIDQKNLKHVAAAVMNFWAKQGYLVKKGLKGREVYSVVKITDEGREIVERLIVPIRRVLSGDEDLLKELERIDWQKDVASCVSKYRESSGYANSKPVEEWVKIAYGFLKENPGARGAEIEKALGRIPFDLLKLLIRSDLVRKERSGKAVRYYPVDSTNPSETQGPTS